MTHPDRKHDPFPLERLERLMLMAAELVDDVGEELRPLLDYWQGHYLAKKNRRSAADEVRELIGRTG